MTDYAARRTNMVDTQVRPNDVTKYPIIAAMLVVPREEFVPAGLVDAAYTGETLALGGGAFLLEPRTFAKLLDALDIGPGDRVLDVGAGPGYSAAVIGRIAGQVVALVADAAEAGAAGARLAALGAGNVTVRAGALAQGAPQDGPFDRIILQGAVERLPAGLTEQLKEGGRIGAVFMEGALGVARIGHRIDGQISWRYAFNAAAPVLDGFAAEPEFQL